MKRNESERTEERGRVSHCSTEERGRVSHCSIAATYSYDALDRPLSVTYPDPAENVVLTYDTCPFGVGRLCTRVDESGSYAFAYANGVARTGSGLSL